MNSPTTDEINNTLRQLEQTKMEIVEDAPRWYSDAERLGLPVVNRTTGSGAPLLNRDKVLRDSLPNCVGLR